MKYKILSFANLLVDEISDVLRKPEFRKASRNMALANAVLEKALGPLQNLLTEEKEFFGLVLTSESGEIETTVEFLRTWTESRLARPLLFQNSLHNSTSGFLAIRWGLTGPVVTASSSPFGVENALELGSLMLASGQCRYCIVLSVDIWPMFEGYKPDETKPYNGASCLVLTQAEIPAKAVLTDLKIKAQISEKNKDSLWEPMPLSQNILYRMVEELESRNSGTIEIEKSGLGKSSVTWEKVSQ